MAPTSNLMHLDRRQNVGVTGIQDSHSTNSEHLTANGTQFVVTSLEVEDLGLGQHSVVLQLRLSQDRSVSCDDNQLSLTSSESLDSGLESQGVLTGFDSQT